MPDTVARIESKANQWPITAAVSSTSRDLWGKFHERYAHSLLDTDRHHTSSRVQRQVVQQRHCVERVTTSARVQPRRGISGRGRGECASSQHRHAIRVERRQADLAGEAVLDEGCDQGRKLRNAEELVGSDRGHDQHPSRRRVAAQVVDRLPGRAIGLVEVVQQQDQRSLSGQGLEQGT